MLREGSEVTAVQDLFNGSVPKGTRGTVKKVRKEFGGTLSYVISFPHDTLKNYHAVFSSLTHGFYVEKNE